MWFPFHLGWLFLIVPLAMMLMCLLCVMICRLGCGVGCCRHMHRNERQGTPSSEVGGN
jgi:hypothetical protein